METVLPTNDDGHYTGPERRGRRRTIVESRATTLIQAILRSTKTAAADIERDLRGGADATVTSALLIAAEAWAKLRGVDLGSRVAVIRARLKRHGYEL